MKNLNEEIGRIKSLMGILTEDTEDKIAVLFDGTSSAGKSYTAKQLNAVPFHEATDPNEWVVIDNGEKVVIACISKMMHKESEDLEEWYKVK